MIMDTIKLAIVEDHAIIRLALAEYLRRQSELEVVLEAGNGKIFLEKIRETNVDLVLLDVEMPVMNGKETLQAIRKLYPDLKVIMYSARSDQALIDQFLKLGADDFVCKMCSYTNLMETINKYKALC